MNEVETNVGQSFVQSLGEQPATPELEDTGEEETPADSQPDKEPVEKPDNGTPAEGEGEKKKGFHEHPAWIEREQKWEQRMKDQEKTFNEKYATLESKIAERQEAHSELTDADVPDWFNGDLDTYKKYYAHQTKLMEDKATKIAEKLVEGKFKSMQEASEKQTKAVQEATDYFRSEVDRIEKDATLNPDGAKIDRQRLLEIAQEEDLIDSKGRWNWKAAFRVYKATETKTETDPKQNLKKNIAAITTKKDSTGGASRKSIASSDTFKNKGWDSL